MEGIRFTTEYAPFADADFVIENVTEKWDIKKKVHEQLDAVCPEHCVFAANTSAISITRIGSVTKRPGKVIGMHFMNPVPMKPMVEVIRGYHTSEETIATAKELLAKMGKECVVVKDMPGFVSNRVLMLTVNEASVSCPGSSSGSRGNRHNLQIVLWPQDGPSGDSRLDWSGYHTLLHRGSV